MPIVLSSFDDASSSGVENFDICLQMRDPSCTFCCSAGTDTELSLVG